MRRQRGVALLTALLVIALITMIGGGMLTHMNLAYHRSGNLWLTEQAWWYAVGVEGWAGQILARDARDNEIDSLDQAWAQPVDYLPIEGGGIQGQLVDLQGRLNLNNLAGPNADSAMSQLRRLIEMVSETDVITARRIAQGARDWVDADINPTLPDGAEDNYYLGLDPAYRTGNQLMASPSELRAVREVSGRLYEALKPYITALPSGTAINVNTAPAPVLATLHERLELETAETLVKRREESPWQSVDAFLQEGELAGLDLAAQNLSVASNYFLATGRVTVGRAQLTFHSVLNRGTQGEVKVLRHSRDVR